MRFKAVKTPLGRKQTISTRLGVGRYKKPVYNRTKQLNSLKYEAEDSLDWNNSIP